MKRSQWGMKRLAMCSVPMTAQKIGEHFWKPLKSEYLEGSDSKVG